MKHEINIIFKVEKDVLKGKCLLGLDICPKGVVGCSLEVCLHKSQGASDAITPPNRKESGVNWTKNRQDL